MALPIDQYSQASSSASSSRNSSPIRELCFDDSSSDKNPVTKLFIDSVSSSDSDTASAAAKPPEKKDFARKITFHTPQASTGRKTSSSRPPPAPRKPRVVKENIIIKKDLFSISIDSTTDSPLASSLSRQGILTTAYTAPSGINYTIVEQKGKKTCGQTCAMMLAIDKKEQINNSQADLASSAAAAPVDIKLTPGTFSDDFIRWFNHGATTKAEDLADKLGEEGFFSQKVCFFDSIESFNINEGYTNEIFYNDPINIIRFIEKTIRETGNSFIIAIDHKDIGGHWVIIDEISADENHNPFVYIRDPYTAKAYKVPVDEFAKSIYDNNPLLEAYNSNRCEKIEGLYLGNLPK